MAKKDDSITLIGVITKRLPGAKFLVHVEENNLDVTCGLSGKLRQNKIKITENDKVEIEVSVYDFTTGRITWRL